MEGETVNLYCDAENGSVRWYHQNLHSDPINFYNKQLVIDNASISNGGSYWCYGQYSNTPHYFLAETAIRIFCKWHV